MKATPAGAAGERKRTRRPFNPDPYSDGCYACRAGILPGHVHVNRPEGEPTSLALPWPLSRLFVHQMPLRVWRRAA